MSDAEIRNDNTQAAVQNVKMAMLRALEEIGIVAEGYAKDKCPVDTGRLRDSISHSVDDGNNAVHIGTNVEYAAYVELGTSRQKAQPYLRPAAQDHAEAYRGIVEKHMHGA